MNFKVISVVVLCLSAFHGFAEEQGRFSGSPTGTLITDDETGKTLFKLSEPFSFVDSAGRKWETPTEYASDGASIPDLAKSLTGGSFDQRHVYAAIIHDYYSCMRVRSEFDTHSVYYEGLRAAGVDEVGAKIQANSVFRFGPHWYEPPADRVREYDRLPGKNCIYDKEKGQYGGNQYYDYLKPPFWLWRVLSPAEQQIAARKLIASNRVLLATGGAFFDVNGDGVKQSATLQQMFDEARRFNELLFTDAYLEDPTSLGLLATEKDLQLDDFSRSTYLPPGWDALSDDFIALQLERNAPTIEFEQRNFQMIEGSEVINLEGWDQLNLNLNDDANNTTLLIGDSPSRLSIFVTETQSHEITLQYPDNVQRKFVLDLQQGRTEFEIPNSKSLDPTLLRNGAPVPGDVLAIELSE